MKPIFLRFVLSLSIYSLIFISVGFATFNYLLPGYTLAIVPFVLICFFFHTVTLIVHYVLLKSSEKNARKLIFNFMALTVLKLLTYSIVLVGCILSNKENAVGITITFLILYLFYTGFETLAILNFFKKEYKK